MALETGNYINDLVITNPTSSDPKSAGDDHLRLLKKTLKETLNGFTGAILVTATDTGNATAHVLTPSTALIGYTPMLCLLYLPATTNTGAVTVNVSGLGAKSIKTMYGADPTAGDIVANLPMLLMYNGTNFLLLAGAGFMGLTGNQTLTGNLTITGSETVTVNQSVSGNQTVSGTSNLTTVVISGSATAPTVTAGDNSTKIATTAFVANALTPFAPLASPSLTGTPTSTTAATGTNTTQIATCAFVMAQAFNVALPAQSGNAGKFVTTDGANASWGTVFPSLSGNTGKFLTNDGANASWGTVFPSLSGNTGKFLTNDGSVVSWGSISAIPSLVKSSKTSAYTVVAGDKGTLIEVTSGTFTLSLTAAATLGSGWWCYVSNIGTGLITIDPNSSETITVNGTAMSTWVQWTNEIGILQCDGTNFHYYQMQKGYTQQTVSSAVNTVSFSSGIAGRKRISISMTNIDVTAATTLYFKINNTSMIKASAGNNAGTGAAVGAAYAGIVGIPENGLSPSAGDSTMLGRAFVEVYFDGVEVIASYVCRGMSGSYKSFYTGIGYLTTSAFTSIDLVVSNPANNITTGTFTLTEL